MGRMPLFGGPQSVRCGPATVAPAAPAPRPSLLSQFIKCSFGLWPCSCSKQVQVPTSLAGFVWRGGGGGELPNIGGGGSGKGYPATAPVQKGSPQSQRRLSTWAAKRPMRTPVVRAVFPRDTRLPMISAPWAGHCSAATNLLPDPAEPLSQNPAPPCFRARVIGAVPTTQRGTPGCRVPQRGGGRVKTYKDLNSRQGKARHLKESARTLESVT